MGALLLLAAYFGIPCVGWLVGLGIMRTAADLPVVLAYLNERPRFGFLPLLIPFLGQWLYAGLYFLHDRQNWNIFAQPFAAAFIALAAALVFYGLPDSKGRWFAPPIMALGIVLFYLLMPKANMRLF